MKTYMVRWNNTGTRGFGSTEAAQQYIDHVCMAIAPKIKYWIEKQF